MLRTSLELELPKHLKDFNAKVTGQVFSTKELMCELINFGHEHIQNKGCGPFVAAIQSIKNNEVLVVGANLVAYWNQGWAHAERVAIALAQKNLNSYRLTLGEYRMLTTSQMCIACYGESLASGLKEIVASATSADIEELTSLKEGVLPTDWIKLLAEQGISYTPELERDKGRGLLKAYGKDGLNYFDAGSGGTG